MVEQKQTPSQEKSGGGSDMIIAYAGEPGSYSHLACQSPPFRESQAVGYASFSAALAAVGEGRADQAMIPIENPIGGRVPAVHALLRDCKLSIVAEHFQSVRHCLLARDGATRGSIRQVLSHRQALDQCQRFLSALAVQTIETSDTASAARAIAEGLSISAAAIASKAAADIYNLRVLSADIQDLADNATRFVVFARQPLAATATPPPLGDACGDWITACRLHLRGHCAALSEVLACLALNRIPVIKCETYMAADASFQIDALYVEFIGHPQYAPVAAALAALREQCPVARVLGTFPSARQRATRRGGQFKKN